jgi:hypothetical protein
VTNRARTIRGIGLKLNWTFWARDKKKIDDRRTVWGLRVSA